MATTPSAPTERLLRHAEELVRSGTRPTVDLLVAHCGGSRTTAQNALNVFWRESLPALLTTHAIEGNDLPASVAEALRAVWGEAQRQALVAATQSVAKLQASAEADAALAESRMTEATQITRDAENAIAGMQHLLDDREGQIQALNARNDKLSAALEELRSAAIASREEAARLRSDAGHMGSRIAELQAALGAEQEAWIAAADAHARELAEHAKASAQSLADTKARADAAIATMSTAHTAAFSQLQEAHLSAMQRIQVDLDAARTEAKVAQKRRDHIARQLDSVDARLRAAESRLRKREHHQKDAKQWESGYYCAVALLLRECGCVTTEVRSLFDQGSWSVEHIDTDDAALFIEHKLLASAEAKASRTSGARYKPNQ